MVRPETASQDLKTEVPCVEQHATVYGLTNAPVSYTGLRPIEILEFIHLNGRVAD